MTMRRSLRPALTRSRVTGVALLAAAVLILLVLSGLWGRLAPVPTSEEAEKIVFGDLLAYSSAGSQPRVVFRDGERVVLDRLVRGTIAIDLPPIPRWQLTGRWYSMPASAAPASVGVVACSSPCSTPTTLFGELRVPLVSLEVSYDGRWRSFPVSGDGFLIELDGFHGVPDAYRWLDAEGLVWASGRAEPLTY